MWKQLSLLALLFMAACGSDEPQFNWNKSTGSFLYENSEGKISTTFGNAGTSTFSLVGEPKKNRGGIDQIRLVVSNTLAPKTLTVIVKGLSCCHRNATKTLTLTKDSAHSDPQTTAYTASFKKLEASKPPYKFMISTAKAKNLLLEL